MKIGFPNHPRKDIRKEIEWIGRNGFDFVDLFLEEDKAIPEKIEVDKIKGLLKKYNLDVIGHTAWYLPIGSPVKLFREMAIKEATKYFRCFNKLGVRYVTIHAHWPPSLFSEKEGIKFQAETLKKLVEIAKRYEITLLYEPIDTKKDSLKNVLAILNSVQGLYFHLDIGHANLFNKSVIKFIKQFHKKLRHIHLHDNHGKTDEHLPIGKGNINFQKIMGGLKKYGYDGTITLEIFYDKKFVLQSKKRLKKIFDKINSK